MTASLLPVIQMTRQLEPGQMQWLRLDFAQASTHQQQGKQMQLWKHVSTLPFDFGAVQLAVPPVVCHVVVPLGAYWIGGVASITISSSLRVWTLATDSLLKLIK